MNSNRKRRRINESDSESDHQLDEELDRALGEINESDDEATNYPPNDTLEIVEEEKLSTEQGPRKEGKEEKTDSDSDNEEEDKAFEAEDIDELDEITYADAQATYPEITMDKLEDLHYPNDADSQLNIMIFLLHRYAKILYEQ